MIYNCSIVIVYTNNKQLNESKKYIQAQKDCVIETIFIDNTKNRFKSAASALNYGASKANYENIIFMHQDVYMYDELSVYKICDFLSKNNDSIIGVAGSNKDYSVISDLVLLGGKEVETKEDNEEYFVNGAKKANGKIYEVMSVDECLIGIKKERFDKIQFDEKTCDGWHLYGVDLCLMNLINNGKNYVVPLKICHESSGNRDDINFVKTLGKIIKKYKKTQIKEIYTTCVRIKCDYLSYYLYKLKKMIKFKFFKKGV